MAKEHGTIKLDDVKVGERFRKDLGDVKGLAANIETIGLLSPIVVTECNELVDGKRRLEALRLLGRDAIPCVRVHLEHLVLGEYAANAVRKDFTPSELVAIGEAVRERLATPVGRPKKGESFHHSAKGKTRDKVAALVGVSGRTYEKAAQVVRAAARSPERYGALVEEMDRTGKVDGAYEKLRWMRERAKVERERPGGPYRVIVADPPWDVVGLEQLKTLRGFVQMHAHRDSTLWLWATATYLREACELEEAWGFEHKTILTWVKPPKEDEDKSERCFRETTEHCLLAARGSPVRGEVCASTPTVLLKAPDRCDRCKQRDSTIPVPEHGGKPEEFYRVVDGCAPGHKLHLFGTAEREWWTVYDTQKMGELLERARASA